MSFSFGPRSDSDINNFIAVASISNPTEQLATAQLVRGIKQINLWDKFHAIYPILGSSENSCKYNLKDPQDLDSAYRLDFNGTWTYSSTGAQPSIASSAYAETFFNLSSSFTTANRGAVGGYWRTIDPSDGRVYLGAQQLSGTSTVRIQHDANEIRYIAGGNSGIAKTGITDFSGFLALSRRASNDFFAINRDGTFISSSIGAAGFPDITLNFARLNFNLPGGYSDAELAFGFIADDLTQSEMTSFRTVVIEFMTVLGRQV